MREETVLDNCPRALKVAYTGLDGWEFDDMIKRFVVDLAERSIPKIIWRRRLRTWKIDTGELEEDLISWVCDSARSSVDVGAADGAYTVRLFLHSAAVIAFEPRPAAAEALRTRFRNLGAVSVEQVALSDTAGSSQLRIPPGRPMLATIDPRNQLTSATTFDTLTVQRKRLDDYELRSIGFIKIDVEGHEQRVLAGAADTIARERPLFLIEIEKLHNPDSFAIASAFFANLKYLGFFLLDGKLVRIEKFVHAQHQDPDNLTGNGKRVGVYINNFLFIPEEQTGRIPASYAADIS
jgi:FkbM family methyltransferase